jgi:adenosylhomocysteine nucleosidase
MKRHLLTIVISLTSAVLLSSCSGPARHSAGPRPLAVLGALNREVTLLDKMLVDASPRNIEGMTFVTGRLEGRPVVVAWTGVGKVNAAMTTTLLLEHFQPTKVIFTGVAGATDPNLEPGDIVIARQTAYHDMGTLSPTGLEYGGVKNPLTPTGDPNPVFFPADPALLTAAEQVGGGATFEATALPRGERPPKVVVGTVVTGDAFVASKEKRAALRASLGASAVEMEGAAVAQLCFQRNVGCLVIRSITDKADESAIVDQQLFLGMAARNSTHLVTEIARILMRGTDGE